MPRTRTLARSSLRHEMGAIFWPARQTWAICSTGQLSVRATIWPLTCGFMPEALRPVFGVVRRERCARSRRRQGLDMRCAPGLSSTTTLDDDASPSVVGDPDRPRPVRTEASPNGTWRARPECWQWLSGTRGRGRLARVTRSPCGPNGRYQPWCVAARHALPGDPTLTGRDDRGVSVGQTVRRGTAIHCGTEVCRQVSPISRDIRGDPTPVQNEP